VADETPSPPPAEPSEAPPAEKKRTVRRRAATPETAGKTEPAAEPTPKKKKAEAPRAPKRAALSDARRVLLRTRRSLDVRRPIFGRQAANRYFRIGRDGTWRRPRGLQSKQRRHYGYRAKIVRIGYRSPAAVRGLVPSGFRPILVRTTGDLESIDAKTQAAVIARTVGTRRRLVLEETARKLGIHILNPIVKGEGEA
jgi:large subunit ribosomal protein L32e